MKQIDTNEIYIIDCYYNRKFIKKVPMIKGGLYKVNPTNQANKKMKGERVVLITDSPYDKNYCIRIDSPWHKRRKHETEINLCDLELITKNPDLKELGIEIDFE